MLFWAPACCADWWILARLVSFNAHGAALIRCMCDQLWHGRTAKLKSVARAGVHRPLLLYKNEHVWAQSAWGMTAGEGPAMFEHTGEADQTGRRFGLLPAGPSRFAAVGDNDDGAGPWRPCRGKPWQGQRMNCTCQPAPCLRRDRRWVPYGAHSPRPPEFSAAQISGGDGRPTGVHSPGPAGIFKGGPLVRTCPTAPRVACDPWRAADPAGRRPACPPNPVLRTPCGIRGGSMPVPPPCPGPSAARCRALGGRIGGPHARPRALASRRGAPPGGRIPDLNACGQAALRLHPLNWD